MKKLFVSIFLALALILAGCSSDDDNGTDSDDGPRITRVVVDTLAVAPTLVSVAEATWSNVDTFLVEIGGNSNLYGRDASLGKQDITVKAIKKSDTLYLWVRWQDYSAHVKADYMTTVGSTQCWEKVTSEGQDVFSISLYAPDTSSDSGSYDIWAWMATQTAPGRMAEDRWRTPADSTIDPTLNYYVYRTNVLRTGACDIPTLMHKDTTDFTGTVMYLEDTVAYSAAYTWFDTSKIPGYFIDSSIFNLPTRSDLSMWDVKAISHFDSTGASSADYTWTVVFARALDTQHADDVYLSGLDSVKVSFIADNKSYDTQPAGDYSGSAPFWVILKP